MNRQKKCSGYLLSGAFRGSACRLSVECYPKTEELKVTLLPVDGSPSICLTQNLGQPMPPYQAFLADGVLEPGNTDFMDYAERNGLGYIADFKRYDFDVFTGKPRKTVAVFQFNKSILREIHPSGYARYERHCQHLRFRSAMRQYQIVGA